LVSKRNGQLCTFNSTLDQTGKGVVHEFAL
jgi:hypothetical protein